LHDDGRITVAMKNIIRVVLLFASLAAVVAPAASAATPATKGFYDGKTINYLDFGPIHLARGNKIAPIWAVTNGLAGQHNVVDVVPGQKAYTPLWQVIMVTFKPGVKKVLVKSADQVRALQKAHKVTLKKTSTIVNCPVLGFGQKKIAGYFKGRTIHYLDDGPVKLAAGNAVAPLWSVTNGTAAQHNIIDVVPGDKGYSPLWSINMVARKAGVKPRTLTFLAALKAAQKAGQVTVKPSKIVVNCPVI
jgi:hypothetical protein